MHQSSHKMKLGFGADSAILNIQLALTELDKRGTSIIQLIHVVSNIHGAAPKAAQRMPCRKPKQAAPRPTRRTIGVVVGVSSTGAPLTIHSSPTITSPTIA
eukprot:INCI3637.1.p1 GENE.INCI3637.1~~INCI3637.1.p1  ORF type:complete len:101 (-),score=9.73 INCI3637.1:433-735(-)